MSNNNNNEDINDDEWHTVAPRRNRARRTTAITPDNTPVRNSFRALIRDHATLFNEENATAPIPATVSDETSDDHATAPITATPATFDDESADEYETPEEAAAAPIPVTTELNPSHATITTNPIPTTIELDIDYDDMTPSHPPAGTLATLIGSASLAPERTPTTTTLTVFQKKIANHLAKAPSRMTPGGYAWLVEDKDMFKLRIGNNDAAYVMPKMPTMPVYNPSFDAVGFKHYDIATSFYVTSVFYNSEVISTLEQKFPSALSGLEVQPGVLPSALTGQEAIEHIRTTIVSITATNNDYASLLTLHLAERYEPVAAGPVEYLKTCRTYQQQVKDLGLPSVISDDHLMAIAVTAFDNSGHNPSLIARVHRDYTEKCNVVIGTDAKGQNVTNGTGYDFFATFYIKELRLLYEEGDRGKDRQQAHLTETLQTRIDELEAQMEATEANMHQVNDNVHEIAASAAASKSDGSTGTNSTGMSTITEDGMAKMIAAMVATAIKSNTPANANNRNSNSNGGGGGGGGGGNTARRLSKFRTYNCYCFSRGINTHCNGTNCRRTCDKKPNHDSSATYDNRKGGSDHLEERWGKLCGPDNNVYNTRSEYTGPTLPGDN